MNELKSILNNESGQSLVEYSLILSLVVLAAVSALVLFGDSVVGFYETIKEEVINVM